MMSFVRQRRFWDLLIASFVALFFEMLLVRWLPTTIYYLGYYKNGILFATFLGFECGIATKRRVDRVLPYFILFVATTVISAVYTVESFRQARSLLKPGGLLQVTYAAVDFVRLRIVQRFRFPSGKPEEMQPRITPNTRIAFGIGICVA